MDSRTIDNLGYDASLRYAKDQKLLEGQETFSHDSKLIFSKTSIEVTEPIFSFNEAESGFHAPLKNSAWAEFLPPSFFDRPRALFTYELLPALGGKEKLEELKQRIATFIFPIDQEEHSNQNKEQQWELLQEEEQMEKEKKALSTLLDCILHLDHCIMYVYTKRAQYHKG